ncbi:MAG: bifunctional phosphoribosylaminoimidazolecarboxamide formyltransferase/IMP cyclohydrolase [Verrucomicrobiae bacterium]|nr:bifunctional phosphoribosylaminoimidazolecarboxamide formyltransferase/IMP cyclohydrolase [Verrucomicrobiae bacterium]
MKVKRALLSVSDKTDLLPLAQTLVQHNIELIATDGTAQYLKKENIPVIEITTLTGFPEMLDGRVKTLHPQIHAALLFQRDNPTHQQQTQQHNILPIDLIIVNLYPFEKIIHNTPENVKQAIENIDIGGVALLRSAAKNFQHVTAICNPQDYLTLTAQLKTHGNTTLEYRKNLAQKVFQHTSAYDALIANYLTPNPASPPDQLHLALSQTCSLRYGENPHQKAAFYGKFPFQQLHGKELSYNNLLDTHAALQLIHEFTEPTAAILKHTNPCGVGSAHQLIDAWDKAYATDPFSPFGGILIFNRTITRDLAQKIHTIFCEILLAHHFEPEALDLLKEKKNLRILQFSSFPTIPWEIKSTLGGLLLQQPDNQLLPAEKGQVVTRRQPTEEEWQALHFGWRVVKHVKSNAIVYTNTDRTLGIGAGQMSRIDASQIAIQKAHDAGLSLKNSIIASDAFFPFADGVLAAAKAGATAVIQPGGSLRDKEVIEACNHHNLAMILTSERHFRH